MSNEDFPHPVGPQGDARLGCLVVLGFYALLIGAIVGVVYLIRSH